MNEIIGNYYKVLSLWKLWRWRPLIVVVIMCRKAHDLSWELKPKESEVFNYVFFTLSKIETGAVSCETTFIIHFLDTSYIERNFNCYDTERESYGFEKKHYSLYTFSEFHYRTSYTFLRLYVKILFILNVSLRCTYFGSGVHFSRILARAVLLNIPQFLLIYNH